jgi:catechol 2,3-dioxygenase
VTSLQGCALLAIDPQNLEPMVVLMSPKIGHAHIKVRNLDRAVLFYQRYIGLSVQERIGDRFVFMTGGNMHHELALQDVGPAAPAPPEFGTGLFHVAFEVPSKGDLAIRYRRLRDDGVPVSAVDHRISWAIYFSDPNGNGLELYCDTRAEPDGADLWEGADRPLEPARLLALFESQG